MQLKKIAVSSLLLMLLLGIFAVFPARADFPANAIWVEPQVYNATENGKTAGDTFTVSVWINVTADLYGFEYKLRWNDTLIKHVSHTYYLPWTPNFVAKDQAIAGQYWFGASGLAPATPYTGSMKVLDITFQIAYQPYYPESNMSCPLDLVDTKLGDPQANPILHVAYDGLYEINTSLPIPPNLSVTPPEINAIPLGLKVNDTFQVNITIIGLASAWDLYGWEVKLGYNSTLLEVTNVASGGFLTPFQGPYGTFFTYRDRPEYNYVVMAELFLGTGNQQPYGTGTLAVVTFKIIYEEAYPKQASCPLNIFDIKLVSSQMAPISVGNVSQGMYYSPMSKPAGAVIDIYTESFRWPGYYTTNTGETGVDLNPADADAIAPQENITLYAKLTYSQAPVQFKEVAWQINAPNGEVYYRQSFTNESGIATISIRIPWWEDYFGTWTALAKSSVAEVSVNDTVTFVVGYIVTVNSSVTTDPAYRGEDVNVTVWLNNIGTINRDVFVSITIYDDVGMPIASYGRVETVTPGVSTEPFTYTLPLAPWAHVGQGTVYINLFTGASPSECGVCYGPEHVQTFTLKFVP